MNEFAKQAFAAAVDSIRQVLTLSTGVIALVVTFHDKVLGTYDGGRKTVMIIALVAYLVSIVAGILALYAVTNALEDAGDANAANPSVKQPSIRNPTRVQFLFFILGVALLAGVVLF